MVSFTGHKRPVYPPQFLVNTVTRQQRRLVLRKLAMDFMRETYGGELRAKRRELGLARAQGGWRMLQMQERLRAAQEKKQ